MSLNVHAKRDTPVELQTWLLPTSIRLRLFLPNGRVFYSSCYFMTAFVPADARFYPACYACSYPEVWNFDLTIDAKNAAALYTARTWPYVPTGVEGEERLSTAALLFEAKDYTLENVLEQLPRLADYVTLID